MYAIGQCGILQHGCVVPIVAATSAHVTVPPCSCSDVAQGPSKRQRSIADCDIIRVPIVTVSVASERADDTVAEASVAPTAKQQVLLAIQKQLSVFTQRQQQELALVRMIVNSSVCVL